MESCPSIFVSHDAIDLPALFRLRVFFSLGLFWAGFRVWGLECLFQGCAKLMLLKGFCSGKVAHSKSMGLES